MTEELQKPISSLLDSDRYKLESVIVYKWEIIKLEDLSDLELQECYLDAANGRNGLTNIDRSKCTCEAARRNVERIKRTTEITLDYHVKQMKRMRQS